MTPRPMLAAWSGLALAGVLLASLAWGQPAKPVRIRGVITAFDGKVLTAKLLNGDTVRIALEEKIVVLGVAPLNLEDIKPGSYVGAGATPQPDGTFKAEEVLVFPENMRGRGEGHRPWDKLPGSTMTNATVDTLMQRVSGQEMTLKYKEGTAKVIVPAGTPIVTFVPGDASLLTPGAHLSFFAQQQADGSLRAASVSVGINGLVPPM